MLYMIDHTAGQIFGPNHIKTHRPSKPLDGQENSANGTGPEKTCARQGGVIRSTACWCHVFAVTTDQPSYPSSAFVGQIHQSANAAHATISKARTYPILLTDSRDPSGNQSRILADLLAA